MSPSYPLPLQNKSNVSKINGKPPLLSILQSLPLPPFPSAIKELTKHEIQGREVDSVLMGWVERGLGTLRGEKI